MDAPPVMVRLSPAERADLDAKARTVRQSRSAAIRMAVAAWEPSAYEAPRRELTLERDDG